MGYGIGLDWILGWDTYGIGWDGGRRNLGGFGSIWDNGIWGGLLVAYFDFTLICYDEET